MYPQDYSSLHHLLNTSDYHFLWCMWVLYYKNFGSNFCHMVKSWNVLPQLVTFTLVVTLHTRLELIRVDHLTGVNCYGWPPALGPPPQYLTKVEVNDSGKCPSIFD